MKKPGISTWYQLMPQDTLLMPQDTSKSNSKSEGKFFLLFNSQICL